MKFLIALSFIAAAACGTPPCSRMADSLSKFTTKADKCASGAKVRVLAKTTCEARISTCTAGDVTRLESYANCLDAVPDCDPANPAAFRSAADACEANADAFNLSCPAGLGT